MKLKDFYTFRSKLLSSTFQAGLVDIPNMQEEAEWKLITGNYQGFTFPIVFKHEYGKKLADVLNTGWPGLYLYPKS